MTFPVSLQDPDDFDLKLPNAMSRAQDEGNVFIHNEVNYFKIII